METLIYLLWLLVKIDLVVATIDAILLLIINLTANPRPKKGPIEAVIAGFIMGLVPFLNIIIFLGCLVEFRSRQQKL